MHIIIIGNGIAGSTAARYIRKYSDHRITMISDETAYPYARTSLMYLFMGHLRLKDTLLYEPRFWKKNRINLIHDRATRICPDKKVVNTQHNGALQYDKLIIATGSAYRVPPVTGVTLQGVQGLYHLNDLTTLERFAGSTREAVIVGGGLIGVELAEMLHSRRIAVSMLIRESNYWANVLPQEETRMVTQHIRSKGIQVHTNTQPAALEDDGTGRVGTALTNHGERLPCQLVGLTIGVTPSISLAKEAGIATGTGILVDEYLQTSATDIYAIGDCAELQSPIPGRQAVEAVWYTGKLMGRTVAASICQQPTPYNPGQWYNSAKFFDLSYQTYGQVTTDTDDTSSFLWQDQQREQLLRFCYHPDNRQIIGFNALGIPLRHRVADFLLQQHWTLERVIAGIDALLMLPTFAHSPTPSIWKAYHDRFPESNLDVNHAELESLRHA